MNDIDLNKLHASYLEIMDKDKLKTNNCVLVAHVLNSLLLTQNIDNEICA